MSADLDLDALAALLDGRNPGGWAPQITHATLSALITAARERDEQFTLAKHALSALETADEVLNQAAGLDAEHAHDLDYRDEVVLGLRSQRDAARAELADQSRRIEAVLSEWGADQPDDFAAAFHEAIEDSGAWRLARDLRAALTTRGAA